MKDRVTFGLNKTGIQMAPITSHQMVKDLEKFLQAPLDTRLTPKDIRKSYDHETTSLGTVPLPGSVKGAITTGMQKIRGESPEILLDQLSARLAFERSGVRLYEALITKCELRDPEHSLDRLYQFRDEELEHYHFLHQCLERLNADPTAMTPSADIVGVTNIGLIQVLNDPRTTLAHCVQSVLIAEMADSAGWDLLIELAREADLTEDVTNFEVARLQEDRHLQYMRDWLRELVRKKHEGPLQ